MRDRIAAARQLGIAGLFRRTLWRIAQVYRIGADTVVPSRYQEPLIDSVANQLANLPIRSFLPSFEGMKEALETAGHHSNEEHSAFISTVEDLLTDHVTLRGVGRIKLNFVAANWYAYDSEAALMVNRHDFLVTMIRGHIILDNDAISNKVRQLFRYWIANFDIRELRQHDTPIDTAIRLINWSWVFNTTVLALNAKERRRLSEIIVKQLQYISVWRSAGGNHLVLEALAHYVYGVMFGNSVGRNEWTRWSKRSLLDQIMRQTTIDGVHTEQSMFYHQAVCTHYLKFVLTAAQANDEIPHKHIEQFRKMLHYVHSTTKPDLTHPVLGDGESLVTEDREHWESGALLAARSVLFGDAIYAGFVPLINDAATWFFGRGVRNNIKPTDSAPESEVFEHAGLACFRDSGNYVFFDAAPFSDNEFPHHGHADALSVELCVDQASLLVDPGGYGYYDDDFRRFFRSTAAHNTLEIGGRSQSELFGVLGYGRLAKSQVDAFSIGPDFDFIRASHDGYSPAHHEREVYLLKKPVKTLVVVDDVTVQSPCEVISRFHASEYCYFDLEKNELISRPSVALSKFRFSIAASADFRTEIVKGRRGNAYQGWLAPETGKVVPSETLEIALTAVSRVTIIMAINLMAGTDILVYLRDSREIELVVSGQRVLLPEVSRHAHS